MCPIIAEVFRYCMYFNRLQSSFIDDPMYPKNEYHMPRFFSSRNGHEYPTFRAHTTFNDLASGQPGLNGSSIDFHTPFVVDL